MKAVFLVFLCFIAIDFIYCRTIGQSLDAGIAHAKHDVEEVGRVITYPVRYVGEKASHAVSATRHAAGDVVEGAARKLHHAGQRIRGDSVDNNDDDRKIEK